MKLNAVFEGGGVKGIAFAGALVAAEKHGAEWQSVAGTSAGAIVAALLAAGYTARELEDIMVNKMDFEAFMDEDFKDRFPGGKALSVIQEYGVYEGLYFIDWMDEMLSEKDVFVFNDLDIPLKMIATDITRGKMIVLPDDLVEYGVDPGNFPVADAVRMSMSIPIFFEPVKIMHKESGQWCYIVDGGLLSNYPMWLFKESKYPTIGFKLVAKGELEIKTQDGAIDYLMSIVSTMLEANDARHISKKDIENTVLVPTLNYGTTQFDISMEGKLKLVRLGEEATDEFFQNRDND
jgi:NTE family protein